MNFRTVALWKDIHEEEWDDWHWQLRHSIKSLEELGRILDLPLEMKEEIEEVTQYFPLSLTPYYLMVVKDAIDNKGLEATLPLIRTILPTIEEIKLSKVPLEDGIGEEGTSPFSYISRFYPDRALIFVTSMCPSYCRYCFRRRKVGEKEIVFDKRAVKNAIEYIKSSPSREHKAVKDPLIRDVILSGGDPLTIGDKNLEWILKQLREISHVRIIRIDTKAPVVLPQRITADFVRLLREYGVHYMMINFVHPYEITEEVEVACGKLADAGIVLGSHTPLLRSVNDSSEVIKELMLKLTEMRVRPYYLIQFIPTKWTEHFRVSISEGIKIMEDLWGYISGIANPVYIVYLPRGAGKVPVYPNYVLSRVKEGYIFRNFENEEVLYYAPTDLERTYP